MEENIEINSVFLVAKIKFLILKTEKSLNIVDVKMKLNHCCIFVSEK